MDPINSINQLMAILKRQMAERGERTARGSGTTKPGTTQDTSRRAATKSSPDEIQRRIGQRLRNLDPEERQGNPGTQIFIESVLAWEFGDEVLTDPRLGDLVASVRETMADDPALQTSLQRLLERLAARTD